MILVILVILRPIQNLQMQTFGNQDSSNMSSETLIVCPNDDDDKWIEQVYIGLALVGALASFVTFLMQRKQERLDGIDAQIKEDTELDRQQALERVRQQLSVFVGPMHRLWKTQSTMQLRLLHSMEYDFDWERIAKDMSERKKSVYWTPIFPREFVAPFLDDPHSQRAILYRNFVKRQLQPIYKQIRTLVLNHMSDLADMPTQEEWLQRFPNQDIITSPYTGSININVIFDSYTSWTYEFDDIIESWNEGDYTRVQPYNLVSGIICNDLIDLLYDKAKEKEARYNQHVSVHKNTRQIVTLEALDKKGVKEMMINLWGNAMGATQNNDTANNTS